jgi:ATP-dependent helicase/DNAse subunit B
MFHETFSASSFATYCLCPFKYHNVYDKKVREPPNKYTKFGEAFHSVIEDLIKKAIKSPKDILDKMEILEEDQKKEFTWILKRFLSTPYFKQQIELKPTAETAFEIPYPEWVFRGRIDAMIETDDGVKIVDYKTGRQEYDRGDLMRNKQVMLYAVAAKKLSGAKKVILEFWHVKPQIIQKIEISGGTATLAELNMHASIKNSPTEEILETTDGDLVDHYESELSHLAENIKNCENPKSTINKYCHNCFFKFKCKGNRFT